MSVLIVFCFFVFFAGMSGAILRKKLYKKILSLSVSLNSLMVLSCIGMPDKLNQTLLLTVYVVGQLGLSLSLYVCHKAKA